MDIEKSLDIIKGKLLMIKKILKNDEENGHSSTYEMQEEDFEAIETLLTAYEKEKEINIELLTRLRADSLIDRDKYWINKIKAKIEDLNKDFKEYENGQEWEIQDEIRGQIEVLQSLLEKE